MSVCMLTEDKILSTEVNLITKEQLLATCLDSPVSPAAVGHKSIDEGSCGEANLGYDPVNSST